MKKNIFSSIVVIFSASVIFFSCVPARQVEEIKAKKEKCEIENAQLKTKDQTLTTQNTELTATLNDINKRFSGLQSDTMIIGSSLRKTIDNYNQVLKMYELLLQKNKELLNSNQTETKKLSLDLQATQENLLKKEDELKKLEQVLNDKKDNLDKLKDNLDKTTVQLFEKEKKIAELQSILNKKDSITKALKDKVSEALNSYMNNGLTVVQKNGKVYVSLDEKLLFASGSFAVDPKGVEALKKLGKVLENNIDINILIEGHTDNVTYSGSGNIKDNWDLSVMRATTIVKTLLSNSKIDAKRLTAAGRSEYMPIDSNTSKESRSKNRRTEIILIPKMDELFKILETN